ncbi:meckelin [Calliphora vicina]|uniref:meckelin n=1 Tax=Calliphora vicina TaxID=7373 RepID=UPI00325B19A4
MDYASERNFNRTLFVFGDVKTCAKNEIYDLNYFKCSSCKKIGENLQTNKDKFSCGCKTSSSPTSVTVYDTIKPYITCHNICNLNPKQMQHKITNTTTELIEQYCSNNLTILPKLNCKFKYINRTMMTTTSTQALGEYSRRIEVTFINWQYDGLCDDCNIQYNFHYQDYCIANGLLRPYLSYNSFWQATTSNQHFGDLKFVAFFCMGLHNQTACNQLANLCVLSHYAHDKNSPCSKFLLNQATDLVYRYGSGDELMAQQQMKPFLYYSKGKETLAELGAPIKGLKYSMDMKKAAHNHLKFFVNTYGLDGSLLRWGSLKLNDLNLCPHYENSWSFVNFLRFAYKYVAIECSLTLEDLVDLAKIYDNNRFISLFLNFTRNDGNDGIFLQTIPILIEDLMPENKRLQKEEWQLVKRFQLIQFHHRHGALAPKAPARYEDSHKLLLFRSLRYADKIELHYDIHENNRISVPLLKLHYRHIEFTNNTTLNTQYNFKLSITYERIRATAKGELVNEIVLPLSLLLALVTALFKANNTRKRRSSCGSTSSSTPLTAASQNNNDDFCHFTFFTEFLLHLISYMALAFLVCFLLHVFMNSLTFLSQDNVELTLPIVKDQRSLELIIYAALILKLIYMCIYFWRLSHFHIFFIDWERPRCGDTNHFNLKNNLETSSVCSSVRTFISDSNVSAWRSILLANEWIQLSGKQKTSKILQGLTMVVVARFLNIDILSHGDATLKIFYISLLYLLIYICQYVVLSQILTRFTGNPIQKYIEHCSLANISVFTLIEPSFGFYIHGRSPHGFADSDITTMIMQLQRETHSICGRRGLLSDTDQCYVIMPPKNLSNYFDKLLLPYQRSFGGAVAGGGVGSTGTHFQKEINTIEGTLEKTSIAYCSVNRFFCAFIDHGIKDMDYIIKEKTIVERLFDCEFENYLTDNKGTFYIDTSFSFTQMFLYGNELQVFILEFLLLLAVYIIFTNLLAAVIAVCIFNKIFQSFYRYAVKENISNKTLIDKRFLM